MCILDFSLLFKLNYKCDYGKSVYITGDIEPLGNWNPRKSIQLTWSDGHIWSKRLPISHDNTKPIEYKYFIAPTDMNASTFDPLWEQGPNRVINLRSISKLAITLDDEWEHRKVRIALHDQGVRRYMGPSARLYLEVNLGVERKTIAMKSKRQRVANLQQYNFWTASLMIPVRISEFQYKFIVEDEKEKMRNVLAQSHHVFSYRRYCIHANEDTAYLMNGGTLIKFDFSFHLPMGFNQITDQIYVGESPKGEGDIEALASRKIKGVLNLQTEDDMKRYGIDWESLKAHYERLGIKVEHLPIVDMDTDELTLKIQDAADMIHKLVQENGKVYVHCTAGKYRSPHAVIFYLWCYKKYELTKAISLVKSKRRRTKIFEKVFNQKMRM